MSLLVNVTRSVLSQFGKNQSMWHTCFRKTPRMVCKCYLRKVLSPCLVCLMLWAAAVCLTVAGYEDVGQASGSGDFCKGAYGTAVAAAASAQNKPASSVSGPGVGECRHLPK